MMSIFGCPSVASLDGDAPAPPLGKSSRSLQWMAMETMGFYKVERAGRSSLKHKWRQLQAEHTRTIASSWSQLVMTHEWRPPLDMTAALTTAQWLLSAANFLLDLLVDARTVAYPHTTTSAHCFCVPSVCAKTKVRRRAHRHEHHHTAPVLCPSPVCAPPIATTPPAATEPTVPCCRPGCAARCHTGPPVTATAHQLDAIAWCYTYTKNEVRSCAPSVCASLSDSRSRTLCLSLRRPPWIEVRATVWGGSVAGRREKRLTPKAP